MPHKPILQQAVSDTAMDIQEAENGTETSKLQFLVKYLRKYKVSTFFLKSLKKLCLTFCSLGHPETSAASAPAPPAAEVKKWAKAARNCERG